MAPSIAQIAQLLRDAERRLVTVKQIGLDAARQFGEAAATAQSIGTGLPDQGLPQRMGQHRQQLEAAFNDVLSLAEPIRRTSTDIQNAMRGRR